MKSITLTDAAKVLVLIGKAKECYELGQIDNVKNFRIIDANGNERIETQSRVKFLAKALIPANVEQIVILPKSGIIGITETESEITLN